MPKCVVLETYSYALFKDERDFTYEIFRPDDCSVLFIAFFVKQKQSGHGFCAGLVVPGSMYTPTHLLWIKGEPTAPSFAWS